MEHGPQTQFAEDIHKQKYRGEGESFREAMNRVASALSDNDKHFKSFREILLHQRFMPAGRIQAAIGSSKGVTPYNCYVSGTIVDSFVDDPGCIMDRAKEAAATMRMGGGIGYDFSTLRPRGDYIKKLQSKSSGPVSFMDIFDAVCRCVASSGHRRGAQMGVLRVDHPDIEEFVHAKQNDNRLTGFNVSIAVTDKFMEAVEHDRQFDLQWNGQVYSTVNARNLWETIMRSTWDWAEPGVLFIDRMNEMNNLYYCETLAATNPCGEQPLPPFGACLLGSFNLVKYMELVGLADDNRIYAFDFDQLSEDIFEVVRAMDNVVDRATYPLEQQRREALSKRRMGLGVTGLANAAEAQGFAYGSADFLKFTAEILEHITVQAYMTSAILAKEKGPFPLYDAALYNSSQFIRKLPDEVRELIQEHGIRNSHLTSIAPTGTISLTADNVSSGIEPVFAYSMERTVIEFDGPVTQTIEDYGVSHFGIQGKKSSDVTIQEHLDVLAVASQYIDSAISKTCNVPADTPWEEFKQVYMSAWKSGCKGITTYQTGGKRGAVLVEKEADSDLTEALLKDIDNGDLEIHSVESFMDQVVGIGGENGAACFIDPATGRHECE